MLSVVKLLLMILSTLINLLLFSSNKAAAWRIVILFSESLNIVPVGSILIFVVFLSNFAILSIFISGIARSVISLFLDSKSGNRKVKLEPLLAV